jgi:putative transposase
MAELYHLLNRGVDKRDIFLTDAERARFVHDLWEFNDVTNAENVRFRVPNFTGFVNLYVPKERIVDVHGWCLMKNHYHLLVSERVEGGITKFLRRLNIGYANYFNEQHKREGTLFQGRTKKVLIQSDRHLLHILNYIHLNPLDYHDFASTWREGSIKSSSKALKALSEYRWSSYLDYAGTKNFPSVLTTELFADVFGNYQKKITEYLRDIDTDVLSSYRLE